MADTEKITINLGVVDLGKIDLLVEQGFYTNRTDFIRNAIRTNLDKHETTVQETVNRKSSVVGVMIYDAGDLEKRRVKGEKIDFHIIGMLVLGNDITPELARETINSIKVLGIFDAPEDVKLALADRIL
ncbi:MAG: CopG family transcriptional regulator [Anaerolineales bacterium]